MLRQQLSSKRSRRNGGEDVYNIAESRPFISKTADKNRWLTRLWFALKCCSATFLIFSVFAAILLLVVIIKLLPPEYEKGIGNIGPIVLYQKVDENTNNEIAYDDNQAFLTIHNISPEKKPLVRGTTEMDLRRLIVYQQLSFKCNPESDKLVSYTAINDDFCDCPENGFDEPGTSACSGLMNESEPTFYCGIGKPTYIFNSKVDDGICDCCNGNDEKEIKCENTCFISENNTIIRSDMK